MAQQSLTGGVDRLHSLMGPGGYLLVVSNLFAVLVLVLWGKRKNETSM
jgi:hypothetical protein